MTVLRPLYMLQSYFDVFRQEESVLLQRAVQAVRARVSELFGAGGSCQAAAHRLGHLHASQSQADSRGTVLASHWSAAVSF